MKLKIKIVLILLLVYCINRIYGLEKSPLNESAKRYATLSYFKNVLLNLLLFESASKGNTQGIIEAIKRSAALDVQNSSGQTPLMLAVINHHSHTAETLVLAGASTKIKDNEGKTALDYATEHKDVQLQKLLKNFRIPSR